MIAQLNELSRRNGQPETRPHSVGILHKIDQQRLYAHFVDPFHAEIIASRVSPVTAKLRKM